MYAPDWSEGVGDPPALVRIISGRRWCHDGARALHSFPTRRHHPGAQPSHSHVLNHA